MIEAVLTAALVSISVIVILLLVKAQERVQGQWLIHVCGTIGVLAREVISDADSGGSLERNELMHGRRRC